MNDPRIEFLEKVDFKLVEVKEYPRIAFLCGGSPDPLLDTSNNKQYHPSVRSYISKSLSVKYNKLRFQNAEDVQDWNSYSTYEDLIEFEKDVAHICKVIVLFVESTGSIAELGSFAMIPEITEKLIVFVEQEYSQDTSFVALGPLKKINVEDKENVHYIEWQMEPKSINGKRTQILVESSMSSWEEHTCEAIKTALDASSRTDHSSEEYARTKEALFIHDIVGLFKAITETEIIEYFKLAKHDLDKKKIQRSIFCLVKLDLIRSVNKGNKVFYVLVADHTKRYLTLTGSGDSLRLAVQLNEHYKHSSQLVRREAIDELVRGISE
jgi:hypothetical protein